MKRATTPAGSPHDLDHVEVEWQFSVDDLVDAERRLRGAAEAAGLRLEPREERELQDQYFETGDWAFHRAGFTLRLRNGEETPEATLKAIAEVSQGPRTRREINQRIISPDRLALLTGGGPVAERVRTIAGGHPLRRLFALRTRRRTFGLRAGDDLVAVVAIDETAVERNGGPAVTPLRRLEIEVSGAGTAETVEPFARQLSESSGWTMTGGSKFQAGLDAARLQPAAAPDLGSTDYDANSSLATVAFASLRRQLTAYLANEPGTRLGEDIEALHDMRVASRRMRTALRVFHAILPEELLALSDELKWVASVLGEVRDLDVQLEALGPHAAALDEPGALEPLRARLDSMREAARGRMLAALDSPRHADLVERLTALLRAGPGERNSGRPALLEAPTLLRGSYRPLHRLARKLDHDSPDEDYHRARIRAKRLRYATEFVEELYGRPARRVLEALKDVQEELGRGQDATIAIQHLHDLASGEPPLPPETLFAMGRLAERETQTLTERGDAFESIYARFRKRWKRLDRALEQGVRQASSG